MPRPSQALLCDDFINMVKRVSINCWC
jgi:hypothetical protein